MCILPLLLSGILGARTSHEQLSEYLRKLLVQNTISDDSWSGYRVAEVIDAVRFLWLVSLINFEFLQQYFLNSTHNASMQHI